MPGRWEVVEESAERVVPQVHLDETAVSKKSEQKWGLEMLLNGDMKVSFLTGTSSPIVYRRVK